MENPSCVVFCTCPDDKIATILADQIIRSKVAACVNIISNLTSIYSWKNKIETSKESLLMIKTTSKAYKALETVLVSTHPYECPEIIALPIEQGLRGYLQWINNTVSIVE